MQVQRVTDRTADPFGERYVLGEPLGVDRTTSVHAARDQLLGRMVALKVLRPAATGVPLRERFLEEARALAAFDSPHLVPVYDFGWRGRSPFVTMKLLSGPTLTDVGVVSEERAVALVAQVLAGLAELHEQGLFHGDLKPANVFVSAYDHVTLADLGILAGPPDGDLHAAGLLLQALVTGSKHRSTLAQVSPPLRAVIEGALTRRFATAPAMRAALLAPRPPSRHGAAVAIGLALACGAGAMGAIYPFLG